MRAANESIIDEFSEAAFYEATHLGKKRKVTKAEAKVMIKGGMLDGIKHKRSQR